MKKTDQKGVETDPITGNTYSTYYGKVQTDFEKRFDEQCGDLGTFQERDVDLIERFAAKHIMYKDFLKQEMARVLKEIRDIISSNYAVNQRDRLLDKIEELRQEYGIKGQWD